MLKLQLEYALKQISPTQSINKEEAISSKQEYIKLKESLDAMKIGISHLATNNKTSRITDTQKDKRTLENTINSKLCTQRTVASNWVSPKASAAKKKNCGTCNLLLSQGISAVHCKRHKKLA